MIDLAALCALRPRLMIYARHLTRTRADAEDLTQDTMCRAIEKADLYSEGNFRNWVFTIMHRLRINEVRRSALEREVLVFGILAECAMPSPQEATVMLHEADRALAQLVPAHRQVLVLAAANGPWPDQLDLAQRLAIPKGTVQSRLSRARAALRRALHEGA